MEQVNLDMYFWINEDEYPDELPEGKLHEITENQYNSTMCSIVNEMYDLSFCEVDWYGDYIHVFYKSLDSDNNDESLLSEIGFEIIIRRHRMDKASLTELENKGFDSSNLLYNGETCLLACSVIDDKIRYHENNSVKFLPNDELYTFLYNKTALYLYEFLVKDILCRTGSNIYMEIAKDTWQDISPKIFDKIVYGLPMSLQYKGFYNYACDNVSLFWKYNEELFRMNPDIVNAYIKENEDVTSSLYTVYGISNELLDDFNNQDSAFLYVIKKKSRDYLSGEIREEKLIERKGIYNDFVNELNNTLIFDDKTWYTMDCYLPLENENKLLATFIIGNAAEVWNVIFYPAIFEIKHSLFYNVEKLRLYEPDMGGLKLPLPLEIGDIVTIDCRPFRDLHHAVVVNIDNSKFEYLCMHYAENGLELKALNDYYHGAEELSPLARLDYYNDALDEREKIIEETAEALRNDNTIANSIIKAFERTEKVYLENMVRKIVKG